MKKLNRILKTFTKTIAKLEKLEQKNTKKQGKVEVEENKLAAKADRLAMHKLALELEGKQALKTAAKIRTLIE